MKSADIFILAGETSGDAYGAEIVQNLRKSNPSLKIAGFGGEKMLEAGVSICEPMEKYSVMGFIPVIKLLPEFLSLAKKLEKSVLKLKPKLIITIDYPGFNLRFLRRMKELREQGTKFIHIVAPQVWAWRQGRARKIAKTVDKLLCFFPFEPKYFLPYGCDAEFVGHPMVDMINEETTDINKNKNELNIMLAPGGRKKEIEMLLPVFDETVKRLKTSLKKFNKKINFYIAKAPNKSEELYKKHSDIPFFNGSYRDCCRNSDAAMIASGTATLEAALLNLPLVLTYKTSNIEVALAKKLLKTKYIGLPNIIHNKKIILELIQERLTVKRLEVSIHKLIENSKEIKVELAKTQELLGGSGAMKKISDIIGNMI